MSTYLYTLRTSNTKKVKTQNGTLPIYHYDFSNGNVYCNGFQLDKTTQRNIQRATTRFYKREVVEVRDEWSWTWRTEIEYNDLKDEYLNGVLVTETRTQKKYKDSMNQPIYYQSIPSVEWIDWNDKIAGVEVGRMVNGKPHFTQKGASLLLEKMGVTIPSDSIIK